MLWGWEDVPYKWIQVTPYYVRGYNALGSKGVNWYLFGVIEDGTISVYDLDCVRDLEVLEESFQHPQMPLSELEEYFAGRRRAFSVPLCIRGTLFQKRVWLALAEIPYGETASYAEIACKTGNPRACRAVGMANHRNPLPIFLPCHRVIGADGRITGYAGGLEIKRYLLELEGRNVKI